MENLAANKLRSALTLLGSIIGIMAVIRLVTVAEGAKYYIAQEPSGLGTNLLIITAGKSQTTGGPPLFGEGTRKLIHEDAMAIEHATNRTDIPPVVIGGSMLKYGNRSRDVTVNGTTYAHQKVRNIFVEVGRFISEEDVESRRRVVGLVSRPRLAIFFRPCRLVCLSKSDHMTLVHLNRARPRQTGSRRTRLCQSCVDRFSPSGWRSAALSSSASSLACTRRVRLEPVPIA